MNRLVNADRPSSSFIQVSLILEIFDIVELARIHVEVFSVLDRIVYVHENVRDAAQ